MSELKSGGEAGVCKKKGGSPDDFKRTEHENNVCLWTWIIRRAGRLMSEQNKMKSHKFIATDLLINPKGTFSSPSAFWKRRRWILGQSNSHLTKRIIAVSIYLCPTKTSRERFVSQTNIAVVKIPTTKHRWGMLNNKLGSMDSSAKSALCVYYASCCFLLMIVQSLPHGSAQKHLNPGDERERNPLLTLFLITERKSP